MILRANLVLDKANSQILRGTKHWQQLFARTLLRRVSTRSASEAISGSLERRTEASAHNMAASQRTQYGSDSAEGTLKSKQYERAMHNGGRCERRKWTRSDCAIDFYGQ